MFFCHRVFSIIPIASSIKGLLGQRISPYFSDFFLSDKVLFIIILFLFTLSLSLSLSLPLFDQKTNDNYYILQNKKLTAKFNPCGQLISCVLLENLR